MRTVPHDKDPNCIMCSPGVPVEVDTSCTLQKVCVFPISIQSEFPMMDLCVRFSHFGCSSSERLTFFFPFVLFL